MGLTVKVLAALCAAWLAVTPTPYHTVQRP